MGGSVGAALNSVTGGLIGKDPVEEEIKRNERKAKKLERAGASSAAKKLKRRRDFQSSLRQAGRLPEEEITTSKATLTGM